MARKTESKTPKAGTKGSAARKSNKTPMGNTRAIDDNSFVAPKKRKTEAKTVTLAEALAESGEDIRDLTAPPADEAPTRPAGTSNLANTIRGRRKSYAVMLAPNGKKTQNTGDQIAVLMLPIPLARLKEFSAGRFEGKTYNHLNPGHARMCIGNLIRAAAKEDPTVLEWLHSEQPKDENGDAPGQAIDLNAEASEE